jgi:hypothetical protein
MKNKVRKKIERGIKAICLDSKKANNRDHLGYPAKNTLSLIIIEKQKNDVNKKKESSRPIRFFIYLFKSISKYEIIFI